MPSRDTGEVLRGAVTAIGLPLALAAPAPAHPQEAALSLGKQRAASSSVEWEVRDALHPALGNIRFAYIKRPVETRVGALTVYSRAYLSCQKDKRSFAIELANAMAPADPGGLKPAAEPRLVCQRPEDGRVLGEEILATWEINPKIGDALTRGLRAFPLRECAAITVRQEVVLPEGAPQKTARIEFELMPYNRELDAVFATCGERSAYGPGPPAAVAAAPEAVRAPEAARAPVTAAPAPRPVATAGAWREARTVFTGKTNVRKGPSLRTAIVAELYPGSVVRVQKTDTEWWRARPNKGSAFDGFIRQDRLVFK
jgi:hypothetical protein